MQCCEVKISSIISEVPPRAWRMAVECTLSPDVLYGKCERTIRGPPHPLGGGVFVFKHGEIPYQYSCEQMLLKLLEAEHCYSNIPIHPVKKYNFLSIANRMLITSASKKPCVPHRIISWIRIGLELRSIPPPGSEPKMALNLTHH